MAGSSQPRPLGVFGGTFDPIHYGHLELAREVREALRLPEVLLVPAGDPPHRAAPVAPASHRLAMAELAVAEYPGLVVDGREVARQGRSYTVLTLQELRAERPFQPLALIVGADAFVALATWHRWRELFQLAHLIVVARPGTELPVGLAEPLASHCAGRWTQDPRDLEKARAGSIYQQAITPHAISASAIRAAIARGDSAQLRGLLPPAVLAYIGRNHLYRPSPDAF
jgi:nicotinate-nucleotide adenylyltransferase